MSQNAAEGNAAFVIWSNECLDWDNWSEAFEEDYANLTEEEKYRLMEELNGDYLDDERRNLDIRVGTPILIIADIGRWDGRHTGDLRMDGYHHDGHNYYLYRKYRQGVSEEAKENFKEKILDHTLTKRDIDRVTERLGDDIAKVYGFSLPSPAKEYRKRSDAR